MASAYQLINDFDSINSELAVENVALKVDFTVLHLNDVNHGIGTLYVCENRVVWLPKPTSDDKKHIGYAFLYPSIVLHAISTDTSNFPEPCIYMQLISDEDEDIPVVRVVPSENSVASLEDIFKSLSEMSSLHSEPERDDVPSPSFEFGQ